MGQGQQPTRAGQWVRKANGALGITTEAPRARGGIVGVQWADGPYPVLESLEDVTVTEATERAATLGDTADDTACRHCLAEGPYWLHSVNCPNNPDSQEA